MRIIDADKLKFALERVTLYVQGLRFGKTVLEKILESYRRAVFEEIDDAPTIDPEDLRPKGRWVFEDFVSPTLQCSVCKGLAPYDCCGDYHCDRTPYCPHCGAKMEVDDG